MKVKLPLLTLEIGGLFVILGLVLFLAAGSLLWPSGWIFLLLFFGFTLALSLWLLKSNPDLLTERMTGIGKADQKTWDKIFYVLANLLFLAWLAVAPLDAVRFHWSQMPLVIQIIGRLMLLCSFYLFYLVFRENSYLSPAVRVQADRGQTVISTGPYSYVRHPMYATALLFLVGATLLLGSWYGLLPVLVLFLGIAVRAVQEERTLQAELPGYTDYMQRVRYRFIPLLW
ncbi:protein-S-isoprenylcysteine O-methyltransferase Ste14 [Thermosporothrix hazakensis]|jgi:protein-S-isoprenylcysteine O-methyltransferase Ste14|uniref:Protein-S-isoprenylcysteine O-methyltransferase Ste14 n=1 Tax=Thermosporothrix hazakensis TaxID=644383 RepID=A0A326U796_THEHA|nr:isoprenylcysteine carboxylmethyltransferase family protein [Thermosporothrix hazakensis]PZW28501.1 protein-S-isoprenylcysteine O-methyltransferase Ste14 [Thermosporothrix hazakensis]GCE45275.1 isoprenylcysteine carboxyl methyltransferase [Thermosporothrix hazakensis]